jgi:hypothetical protein
MIAKRFRALGWVAGIATAATALYIVSLQVAAERAKLEDVERRIGAARRDMVQLRTELSTRASYRQLEKWNDESLDLAAPRAVQYLTEAHQVAALAPGMLEPSVVRPTPRAQLAAAAPVARAETPVRTVAFVGDQSSPQRVVVAARAVIANDTMGDLVRTASREDRRRP